MHVRILVVALAIGICMAGSAAAQRDDPNLSDTLRVDSVAAWTNGIGMVPVRFFNDEQLVGIEVTLTVSSPDVKIDSFSFAGGRLAAYTLKGTYAHTNALTAYCFAFSGESMIPTGNGLMGTLYCSWDLDIPPQLVTVDTTTVIRDGDTRYATKFSDIESIPFVPFVDPGYIDIQQGFGCCIGDRGNVDNSDDDAVNVADLTYLVTFLFGGGPPPDCPEEANINGDSDPEPNVADLTYLVTFLFGGGPDPVSCQ